MQLLPRISRPRAIHYLHEVYTDCRVFWRLFRSNLLPFPRFVVQNSYGCDCVTSVGDKCRDAKLDVPGRLLQSEHLGSAF